MDGCCRQAGLTDVGGGALIEMPGAWDREPSQPTRHVVVSAPGKTVVIHARDWQALERSGSEYFVYRLALDGRLSEAQVQGLLLRARQSGDGADALHS